MTLKECYDAFGGNYQEVKERLRSDGLIQRMVVKFLDDPTYERLCVAVGEENYEEAFREAHTLKGVVLNLSFGRLGESSGVLTEFLRGRTELQEEEKTCCEGLFQQVRKEYQAVVEAIRELA